MFSETGRFRRGDRILCSRDFKRTLKSGKRQASGSFVVVIATRSDATETKSIEERRRLGVTVSKQVGGSVIRNTVKRCIREWFRQARERTPDRSDIVVIARRRARYLSGGEMAAVLDELIDRARTQSDGRVAAEIQ